MRRLVELATVAGRVVMAIAGQFDRRDVTYFIGLVLLASGLGSIPGLGWLAQVVPGAILVAAALGLSFARKAAP